MRFVAQLPVLDLRVAQKKRPQSFGGWGESLAPLYAEHVIPAYAQS